jgi:hypothetical protein
VGGALKKSFQTASRRSQRLGSQSFTIAKEKLPNLPNLPKYATAFSGNVGRSEYERKM